MNKDKQICKRKQMSRELHSKTNTRLYNVWNNIKRRCYTKTNPSYQYYGGCGICMCEEWRKSFSAFYEWSVKNGYNENAPKGSCTIDRIDVNGDYKPSNCRWVSMKEQNLNRKANKIIEYNGEMLSIPEIAERTNVRQGTLWQRYCRTGSIFLGAKMDLKRRSKNEG